MKLLCLHGYGTSGAILELQLAPLLKALGDSHEYVFLDGELSVGQSAHAKHFPGPYLAYHEGIRADTVRRAHELISATLAEEDEPFDGVVGFSQGASLAISYLIQQQIDFPDQPPPFRFALLFSPPYVLSPHQDYHDEQIGSVLGRLTPADLDHLHATLVDKHEIVSAEEFEAFETLSPRERTMLVEMLRTAAAGLRTRADLGIDDYDPILNAKAEELDGQGFPRYFLPIYTPQRVTIPTVHVIGREDTDCIQHLAAVARELCSGGKVFTVEHEGLHEIPRKQKDIESIVNAVERAWHLGQMQAGILL